MKKLFLTFTISALIINLVKGQGNTITVTYDGTQAVGSRFVKTTGDAAVASFDPKQGITITIVTLPVGTTATVNANFNGSAKTVSGTSPTFTIPALADADVTNYSSYDIVITTPNESATYSDVAKPGSGGGVVVAGLPTTTVLQEIAALYPEIGSTDYGLVINKSTKSNYDKFIGDKYSHIFIDQYGKLLLGVIPQGISNRRYRVHVFYLTNRDKPSQVNYYVKQTKGKFVGTPVWLNEGKLKDFSVQSTNGTPTVDYVWAEAEFDLRKSTTDIEFEVQRTVEDASGIKLGEDKVIATYTMEMDPVYSGAFSIGFLNTKLTNPSYTLVTSGTDASQKVVKKTDAGNRVILTAMATLHTSPIILIESLFNKDIPSYKLSGRSFLDDHKIYERIYPVVGVSITEKATQNYFLGLEWEFARGGAVFAGLHRGEVNTFDTSNGLKFGETAINDDEFNLRTGTAWKSGFAFGLNLDITLVTNIFKK